jgi:dihydroorotase
MIRRILIYAAFGLAGATGHAQTKKKPATATYDLLLRGAKVVDPRSGLDGRHDVAIVADRVVRIARHIPADSAKRVVDLRGCLLVPGLIDLHTHVFAGSAPNRFADGLSSVNPDHHCPMNGVTTVVDAGTSGWRNFELFRRQIMEGSKTRVLAFLNIAGNGMMGKPSEEDTTDMEVAPALDMMRRHPDRIVGVKVGHFERPGRHPWLSARTLARQAGKPLFVECHLPDISLEEQLAGLGKGDIITHTFEQVRERKPITDSLGAVIDAVMEARARGVLFDLGHGGAGFWFDQAIPAIRSGFLPNTLGTDLHRSSIAGSMKSLPNVLSKCMAMGMTLSEAIERATWGPAQAIGRQDLGHLTEGSIADIAVLRMEKGRFGFQDAGGERIRGRRNLVVEMTIREGRIIWDLQGRLSQSWSRGRVNGQEK